MRISLLFYFIFLLFCFYGMVYSSSNMLKVVLFMEIILVIMAVLFSFIFLTQNSYFGQMYGLYMLTIGAVESAIVISLILQFYSYRGNIGVHVVNSLF